jgi:LPXTG-motif cell wall-anchored protein
MPGSGSPPLTTAPGSKQQRSAATQAAQALPAGAAGSLPATGAQPLLLALAGASLLLVGAGLRLTAARG